MCQEDRNSASAVASDTYIRLFGWTIHIYKLMGQSVCERVHPRAIKKGEIP